MCVTSLHRHDEGVSRRGFLKAGAAAALGAAATVAGPAAPALATRGGGGRIRDLTHVFVEGFPMYTGPNPVATLTTFEDDGFYSQLWTFAEHSGTRRRARPLRRGQPPRPRVDPGRVDGASGGDRHLRPRRGRSRRRGHRGRHPQLRAPPRTDPRGALVCEYSGWEVRVDDQDAYRNPDPTGSSTSPVSAARRSSSSLGGGGSAGWGWTR